jgi:HTH-type transcriptional regulator / antitoxin HigA
MLEQLVFSGLKDRNTKDEIVPFTLLIEKWDEEHNTFADSDPAHICHHAYHLHHYSETTN